ncbi:hypothetical protein TWF281_008762 [Arthrobotrys megalospora]
MSINIPHPSPHSSLPSTSPIHLSSPSSNSWKHIISVAQAFSDRLSQIPHETPVATSNRWRQRCRDKGIVSTRTSTTEEAAVPPVAPASTDGTNDDAPPKRRRGRPPGRRKLDPPAIVAAKKNLRRISKISDLQWEHTEPEVATESLAGAASQDENSPNLQSTRSSRRRKSIVESSSDDKIVVKPTPLEATDEPVAEPVEADVKADTEAPSEPRTSKKQPTPKHHKPSTLFFFTTLPKPTPPHLQNRVHVFSFSLENLSHGRNLPSEKVVMICMRARVRKQKRMREAGITQSIIQLPQGSWLKRNMRTMEKRMERVNHRKGKNVDRSVENSAPGMEESQPQFVIDNEVETSQEQIDVGEAGTSARRRGRKRKRKSN